MKSYIEKREVLCSLAEIYLNTVENNYISINDSVMQSGDFDSISFLMLLALTYSKEEKKNIYSMDFDIDIQKQQEFVEKEYKKIVNSSLDTIKQGKKVLDDAKQYYNQNYGCLDNLEKEEVTSLNDIGIHI